MGWKFDQPFYCLSDEQEQKEILELWEKEKHGGLSLGNNRIPMPVVILMGLIILTAFMITQPIWGQRPNAAIYVDVIAAMDSAEVQALTSPAAKAKEAFRQGIASATGRTVGDLERHPLDWDDLLNIAPQIKEIQAQGSGARYPLDNYNILGDKIHLANFEGNFMENGFRERKQPWWDIGYTIDVLYVTYFCITMLIVIKQLPHYTRKPDMSKLK